MKEYSFDFGKYYNLIAAEFQFALDNFADRADTFNALKNKFSSMEGISTDAPFSFMFVGFAMGTEAETKLLGAALRAYKQGEITDAESYLSFALDFLLGKQKNEAEITNLLEWRITRQMKD